MMFAVSLMGNDYRVVHEGVLAGVVCLQRLKLSEAFVVRMWLTHKRTVCSTRLECIYLSNTTM